MMDKQDIPRETLDRISRLDSMNSWIVDVIRPYFGRRILEVGCGIGNLTGAFLGGDLLVSIDIRDEYVETVRRRFSGGPTRFESLNLDIEADSVDKLTAYDFDTAICLNVLEHIRDDGKALTRIIQVLQPGGRLLLLVPALKALYGTLDIYVEHHRRYGRREIVRKLEHAGFSVEHIFFMHFAGAFGWWLNSRILKSRILPENQIGLYDRLVPLFRWAEERMHPPVGLSLVAVGRKPG
ncbi:MAG: methyltransferase domain-containing protein [Candidatus Eisenbacteria sp.]|nr:methyltransferase domain-containing protein [Candidatus Eisenbacteria bacterium]